MLLALSGRDRAARIAALVPRLARERADLEQPGDWTNLQSYHNFVASWRSVEAWTEGPEWDRVVVVCPRIRPDGGYWSNIAAEVLDRAADQVDAEAGDEPPPGCIEQEEGSYTARLVCERKPNLERAFGEVWQHAPMVAIDVDGRTHCLSGDLQHTAVTVANRYPFRHGVSARIYGHDLLLLARVLDVDTGTAQRVADLVAPDRCGVYLERNDRLRILSAEQELDHRHGMAERW